MGKALRNAVIGGVLVAMAIALILPALQQEGGVTPRVYCMSNMRQLGLALHQYHERWNCFPPAYVLVEVSPGVPWLAPVDLTEEEALADLGEHGRFRIPKHASNRHVLMVDGAVQGFTAENSNPQTIWSMLTRNGREKIEDRF